MDAIEKNDADYILDAIERVAEDLLLWGTVALAFAWIVRRSDRVSKARHVSNITAGR